MTNQVIKILSYNIHKGFSASNQRFVLTAIKSGIVECCADIVFLQEVVGRHDKHASKVEDWPSGAQFEFLADSVWPHYAYGKNSVYTAGHHGNAILSRFPIVAWSNTNISTNAMESRGLLHAKIELPESKQIIDCFSVHLSLFERGRSKQLTSIADIIKQEVTDMAPFILAGDFNDWRCQVSKSLASSIGATEAFLNTQGSHARTYPAFFPMIQLDRIYVRGLEVEKASVLAGLPWSKLSDHLALYAEIGLD